MGQAYSREESLPYSRVESAADQDAIHVVPDEDEEDESVSNCSYLYRVFKRLFTRKSRKRKRSDEGAVSHRNKIIRLDASTGMESPTRDSESQTCVKTTSVQSQTEDEEEKEVSVTNGAAALTVSPVQKFEESVFTEWLTFPFLDDLRSIQHCQVSKVMLIMRGLPGSGKSTIVKQIQKKFPQCGVCSADDYFIEDGVYNFRVEELKYAHEHSQQKCVDYCAEGRLLVVVDNTNVKRWEMGPYFATAEKFRYAVVLVEPQTPWRLDIDQLAIRNSHGVAREVIAKRVKDFQRITPRYFGWFLNRGDSVSVLSLANSVLLRCLQSSQNFFDTFRQFSGCDTLDEMLSFFSRDKCMGAGMDILHSTAKFFKKGEGHEYLDKDELKDNLGKTTVLKIGGFSISSQTFGAKLMLTTSQLALWAQNDKEMPISTKKNGASHRPPQKKVQIAEKQRFDEDEDYLLSSLRLSSSCVEEERSSLGRRAHLTIGTSGETRPVETGLDVIEAARLLNSGKQFTTEQLPSGKGLVGGKLIQLTSSHWYLQLDRYILVNAMFTGSY